MGANMMPDDSISRVKSFNHGLDTRDSVTEGLMALLSEITTTVMQSKQVRFTIRDASECGDENKSAYRRFIVECLSNKSRKDIYDYAKFDTTEN
jgi:hypothetical protein